MNGTTGSKKMGRPRMDQPRSERVHYYSAAFPNDIFEYMQRAVYRESSPGHMVTMQAYLNGLIRQDQAAHEGTDAGKEKNS